ncbi:vitamin K epoxide reductase family protein [Corynebacterium heidelbergense]|uniref:vitamin K epoxide reductase family protein n=1 Tax=Corynebacterium heidelbergense TaxID=2055947 RepID=UPI001EE70C40|nr:vitamin K epoxide reductase family protein [Corynebacterium heidelbergense]
MSTSETITPDGASTDPSIADHGSSPVPRKPLLGSTRLFGLALTVLSAIGLFFSGLIMQDKIKLILEPGFRPACTFNEVMSCTNVMASEQASAFGFPNPIIGLIGFSVVLTIGVALIGGSRFTRPFWFGLALGLALGAVFVHWLAFEAVFEIAALCIYCMIVWACVLPMFVMTVVHITRERRRVEGEEVSHGIGLPLLVILVWYLAFFVIIATQFLF